MRLYILLIATIWIFGGPVAKSATLKNVDSKDGKTRLDLIGEIQSGDRDALEAAIKKANDANRLVATLRLNSPGGNLLESVAIADIVRRGKIATAVLSNTTCASACFVIFAAGNEKYAHYTAAVGVHGASNAAGEETVEANAATVTMARVIRELGVPSSIIGKMVVTPPSQMVWLTPDDLRSMNVAMLGKPAQLSQAAQQSQSALPASPMSILPEAQANRTPATWSNLVEKAVTVSAHQHGGRANIQRTCQPEQKVCVTGIWFKLNGKDTLVKATSDLNDRVVEREICTFNEFSDVRLCWNWDTGQSHRDMKNAKGAWYKVADE